MGTNKVNHKTIREMALRNPTLLTNWARVAYTLQKKVATGNYHKLVVEKNGARKYEDLEFSKPDNDAKIAQAVVEIKTLTLSLNKQAKEANMPAAVPNIDMLNDAEIVETICNYVKETI